MTTDDDDVYDSETDDEVEEGMERQEAMNMPSRPQTSDAAIIPRGVGGGGGGGGRGRRSSTRITNPAPAYSRTARVLPNQQQQQQQPTRDPSRERRRRRSIRGNAPGAAAAAGRARDDHLGRRVATINAGKVEFKKHKSTDADLSHATDVAFKDDGRAKSICEDVAEQFHRILLQAQQKGSEEELVLVVEGHTSNEPHGHEYSVGVSGARAELCASIVRQRLRTLDKRRDHSAVARLVVSIGFGASRPLPGLTVEGNHAKNRRVEFNVRAPQVAAADASGSA